MLPPSSGWSEDWGNKVLQYVGILPQHYMTSEPRGPRLESSPCKPHNSYRFINRLLNECQMLCWLIYTQRSSRSVTWIRWNSRAVLLFPVFSKALLIFHCGYTVLKDAITSTYRKIKVKLSLNTTPWKRSSMHSLTSALDGGVSCLLHVLAALPPRKESLLPIG
jgi:hypothetical protein